MHSPIDRLVALRLLSYSLEETADCAATKTPVNHPSFSQSKWSKVKCHVAPAQIRVAKLRPWPVPSIATHIIQRR